MRFILAFLTLFSLPLHAQELLPKYQVLGYINLVMDGEARRYLVMAMEDRSFANKYELRQEDDMYKYRLTGVSVREDGEWSFPMLTRRPAYSHPKRAKPLLKFRAGLA